MQHLYWLTESELQEIKGPQGQKSIAAQVFARSNSYPRINVLYSDGLIEHGVPKGQVIGGEAVARATLLRQKARQAGIVPLEPFRSRQRTYCQRCELPLRLCLCPLLESAQKQPGIQGGY